MTNRWEYYATDDEECPGAEALLVINSEPELI